MGEIVFFFRTLSLVLFSVKRFYQKVRIDHGNILCFRRNLVTDCKLPVICFYFRVSLISVFSLYFIKLTRPIDFLYIYIYFYIGYRDILYPISLWVCLHIGYRILDVVLVNMYIYIYQYIYIYIYIYIYQHNHATWMYLNGQLPDLLHFRFI